MTANPRDRVAPDDPSGVDHADGLFVPCCVLCSYEGKPQARKCLADAAIRQHRTAPSHKREVRRLTLAGR